MLLFNLFRARNQVIRIRNSTKEMELTQRRRDHPYPNPMSYSRLLRLRLVWPEVFGTLRLAWRQRRCCDAVVESGWGQSTKDTTRIIVLQSRFGSGWNNIVLSSRFRMKKRKKMKIKAKMKRRCKMNNGKTYLSVFDIHFEVFWKVQIVTLFCFWFHNQYQFEICNFN